MACVLAAVWSPRVRTTRTGAPWWLRTEVKEIEAERGHNEALRISLKWIGWKLQASISRMQA
jgi:hypothetical protein